MSKIIIFALELWFNFPTPILELESALTTEQLHYYNSPPLLEFSFLSPATYKSDKFEFH